jgi:threonine/homoserine/homoserine lactone efflux protein
MTGHIVFSTGFWEPLLALLLEAVIVMGSPGPSTMAVTAAGAAFGARKSLRFVAGAIAGTIAVLLAVAAGIVALLSRIPWLDAGLTVASAVYVFYLAWKIATAPPLSSRTDALVPSLGTGFLLAIANPKAWLAIAAVFAGSTLADSSHEFDAILKVAVLVVMIIAIHLFWLLGGISLAGLFADPLRSRVINIAFALLLIGTTVFALFH